MPPSLHQQKRNNMGALNLKRELKHDLENKCEGFLNEKYVSYLKDHLNGVRPDLSIQPIDLNKYVQGSIQKARKYVGAKNLRISYSIKGEDKFYSNPYYLEFIFDQVIENGILYNDELKSEPFLDIELLVEKDKLILEIVDNGIGVPEDQITNIFNMYFWLSDKSRGFGIGLTLVKKFVESMTGKLYFNSALGIGSHMQIQIPNLFML